MGGLALFFRRVYKTTRDYLAGLRQAHRTVAVPLSLAGVLFVAGDILVLWIIGLADPPLERSLRENHPWARALLFRILPALVLLYTAVLRDWLQLWRESKSGTP